MINFIFTVDYEIYGNGAGSLDQLVYKPAEQLAKVFVDHGARFVNFVEVAEFQAIEAWRTDPGIADVKRQVQRLYREGFEIGLHLHPQWCNAQHQGGRWVLESSEYNLCTLSEGRIDEIVERSVAHLRYIVGEPKFTPLSFRAGNWLFQPSRHAASALYRNGIRVDSSVFKGGLQHNHGLDYRRVPANRFYWRFSDDVCKRDDLGDWVEVPIYTEMVPLWTLGTSKRMASLGNTFGITGRTVAGRLKRTRDFLRFRYPLKLDFCRMTFHELSSMVSRVIAADRKDPKMYRPLVAIGHTKDLTDLETVDMLLTFLEANHIPVVTLHDVYNRLSAPQPSHLRGEAGQREGIAV